MNYQIAHEIHGRIRFVCPTHRYTVNEFDHLDYYLGQFPQIKSYKIYERTGSITVNYAPECREEVLGIMAKLDLAAELLRPIPSAYPTGAINFEYKHALEDLLLKRVAFRALLPFPIRTAVTLCKSLKYFKEVFRWITQHDEEIQMLDIAAVIASILTGQFGTASSIIFLLDLGELLEEWTHKRSLDDLARSLSLNIDQVWVEADDHEIQKPLSDLCLGEHIVVRMGSVIPVDGIIYRGEAMLNQASLTGESIAVRKTVGDEVYAGTVLEEGELFIETTSIEGENRMDRIMQLIEDSELLKSDMQSRSEKFGDRLVLPTFGGSALIFLFTRNVTKAVSILMADYSCTLHLCMPISVLSAMRECSNYGILVKGGKFMEEVAEADTIIFDKTGTLTLAEPRVADVVAFGDYTPAQALRIAACLEEHFPHSIGNAVIKKAKDSGITHEEMHGNVDYIVAHGIVSSLEGKRAVIGSAHFVLEDERVVLSEDEKRTADTLPPEYSHIYLAIDGRLAAIICIEDPLRPGVKAVLNRLKDMGLSKIVMLTGDNERTAHAIATRAGVDDYIANCLPEDKSAYIEQEKAMGRKVIMVGDGINDSPALSAANVGIAMREGAEIANEIADITLSGDALENLIVLRELSNRLMNRIQKSYRFVIAFNTMLILFGVTGILAPSTSAIFHNVSALSTGLKCTGNLIDESEKII